MVRRAHHELVCAFALGHFGQLRTGMSKGILRLFQNGDLNQTFGARIARTRASASLHSVKPDFYLPLSFGSKMSRRASPANAKPNTVTEIATPGKIRIHGASFMY